MPRPRPAILFLAAALSACSFANDTLWPTLSGEDPRGAAAPAAAATPAAGTTQGSTTAAQPSPPGDTAAGKLPQLRQDLARLRGDLTQHKSELQSIRQQLDQLATGVDRLAGGIETGLQSPRTPNDPQLLRDWGHAQSELTQASATATRLNTVSSWATSDTALASYIVQAAHAAASDPRATAIERRELAGLQREADRTSGDVEQLVTETSGEIARSSLFVAAAQRRLAALGPRIAAGGAQQAATAQPAAAATKTTDAAADGTGGRRALVTIRFDRPNPDYQQALYHAVSEALARRPDLAFDIVAVSPPGHPAGAAAESHVESVVKSLTGMGLPADRFRLSAATLPDAAGDEVRIYPR